RHTRFSRDWSSDVCSSDLIGINSNDSVKYPDDSFEAMQAEAKREAFVFPYLFDESQTVAREYGAVCTPDFYVFENVKREEYRERSEERRVGKECRLRWALD